MIITLDPDPPPKKWGTSHEKILWFRISLKHLGAKKKNNRKSDNLLEFRRIFLLLNYKFQLLCLKIMKSCLSKCCFPPAYEQPKSLLISCPKSKKMRRGIAPHFPIIYNCGQPLHWYPLILHICRYNITLSIPKNPIKNFF